jgi:hypothetical protein
MPFRSIFRLLQSFSTTTNAKAPQASASNDGEAAAVVCSAFPGRPEINSGVNQARIFRLPSAAVVNNIHNSFAHKFSCALAHNLF